MKARAALRVLGPFRVGERSVRLAADTDLAEKLLELLAGFAPVGDEDEGGSPAWELYRNGAGVSPASGVRFELHRHGSEVVSTEDFAMAVEQLMCQLTRSAIDGLGRQIGVHAGVVARGDDAVLLAAPSGSGKSTLTAALVAAGWDYLSDELAILDGDSGARVSPFARPLCMSRAAIALFPGLGSRLSPALALDHLEKLQVRPADLRPGAVGSSATVRTVIFPRYERGVATVVEPLRRVETLVQLLPNTFNLAELGQGGLDGLARLCLHAEGYRLVSGDLGEALAAVEDIVTGAWRTQRPTAGAS